MYDIYFLFILEDNAASQKGFMLRPSALTAAADKIENSNGTFVIQG